MQIQFTIPNIAEISTRNWLIAGLLIGAAVLSSIVVELYKRHYFKKKDVKLAKSWTATWLTGASVFFTYLGYALFLASANMPFLKTLPYVGEHSLQVLGIAYTIYNIRLSKWYNGISKLLSNWTKSEDVALPASTTIKLEPIAPLPADQDKTFSLN